MSVTDADVRVEVYRAILDECAVPDAARVAERLGADVGEVEASFRRLADAHALVLADDGRIRMAMPFSGVRTAYTVTVGGASWDANCVWHALSVAALLGEDATIEDSGDDIRAGGRLEVRGGEVEPSEGIVHFAVPAARWWDDIVFT